jgi:hypothetical protein
MVHHAEERWLIFAKFFFNVVLAVMEALRWISSVRETSLSEMEQQCSVERE